MSIPAGQRSTSITGITFCFKAVSVRTIFFKISRWINNNIYNLPTIGFGAIVNRYNNNFSFYSSHEDKLLYSGYDLNLSTFINLGSGGFHHKYWKNYDYPGQTKYYRKVQGKENSDFYPINLCNEDSLNFLPSNIDLVYMSHTLEHIEYSSAEILFKKLSSLMKNKSTFRIAIPDIDSEFSRASICYKSLNLPFEYRNQIVFDAAKHMYTRCKDLDKDYIIKSLIECNFDPFKFSNLIKKDHVNLTTFEPNMPDHHITYWNKNILIKLAEISGFSSCIRTCSGESICKPFTNRYIFDITEPAMSCYYDISKDN